MGRQLLTLALGAQIRKMLFGYYGTNHPDQDLGNGRVVVTRQNYNFEIKANTLPANVRVTISLYLID